MKEPKVEIVAVVDGNTTAAELARLRKKLRSHPGLASVKVRVRMPAASGERRRR